MNLSCIFDSNPEGYDRWRPRYLPEVFKDIIQYAAVSKNSHVIEIGAGTGQATLPFLRTGCTITAIEIGNNFSDFLEEKYRDLSNFTVENISFEEYQGEKNSKDLIYSASAFHWIKGNTGFIKSYDLLKNDAVLAIFQNTPAIDNLSKELNDDIQEIYARYMPKSKQKNAKKDHYDNIEEKLQKFGFKDIVFKKYYTKREFNSKEYVSLLNTYSDHLKMQHEIKPKFESEVTNSIENHGNCIKIQDTIDLCMAKKL
ncbi:methyltransferase domain-containing protein [Methanoplanus sp. FWC-SCC4]|uniref:Methyltransferase domain-containing protein n=1 Tax=Methanochimaera problematica TaxID=2609417 RepID=A0AA97FCC3_9EURY|nr:methyltransferase domain-containing protein [Methanoplanus sp. FWC-SCC4]WOF15443.1 methyltransferase domain-containing protein [Methanoplanus sp. FWC-SCC4]